MPNTRSLQARPRPVVLTGYDLEIDCPECKTRQVVGYDVNLDTHEHVSLHALPGVYLLIWKLRCWNCSHPFSGSLKIASRSAGHSPERRRVWGG